MICAISGTFKYIKENDENISLRLNGDNQILSVSKFKKHYTFILIMRKDLNSNGRLFNNSTENQLFGFWGNQVGSIWLNANVKLQHETNDAKRKFLILRNNNGTKDAWLNGVKYLTASTAGEDDWKNGITIGKTTVVSGENATGYMYEVICFDKALSDR